MTRLDKLIESLEHKNGKHFRDLSLVRKTLMELRDMVGNDETKNQIAAQINYLITMKEEGEQKSIMLNTIIYGSPGVGKTKLGCKLGAIYYGLGYLKAPSKVAMTPSMQEMQENGYMSVVFLLIIGLTMILTPLAQLYQAWGMWVIIGVLFIIAFIGILIYFAMQNQPDVKGQVNNSMPDHTDIVKVVSRDDFVGQYMGWTTPKTISLLNSCRGKVLFIDEAYSLYNGHYDQYGMEAATALNKFMSEHPDETIVIFAGYKKDLEEGLFKVQEGLPRRCMFHIEVPDYTFTELFQIFSLQLAHDGWTLDQPDKILKMFEEEYDAFPSFGGDCERLVNFCRTEHVNSLLDTGSTSKDKIITLSDVKRGIEMLQKNNIHKKRDNDIPLKSKSTDIMELLSHFRPQVS